MNKSKTNHYRFNLLWNPEDGNYVALCPEFPGLSASRKSPDAALREAKVVVELFIETYEAKGIPLPEPETVQQASGQIRLRLPRGLHAEAARRAADDGISLNTWLCLAVQAKTSVDGFADRIPEVRRNLLRSLAHEILETKATTSKVVQTSREVAVTNLTTQVVLTGEDKWLN